MGLGIAKGWQPAKPKRLGRVTILIEWWIQWWWIRCKGRPIAACWKKLAGVCSFESVHDLGKHFVTLIRLVMHWSLTFTDNEWTCHWHCGNLSRVWFCHSNCHWLWFMILSLTVIEFLFVSGRLLRPAHCCWSKRRVECCRKGSKRLLSWVLTHYWCHWLGVHFVFGHWLMIVSFIDDFERSLT